MKSSIPSSSISGSWRDIKRGARTNFLGHLARMLRALYLVLIARLFGSEILGYFLLSWSIVEVASKIGLLGLDRAIFRFVPPLTAGCGGERRQTLYAALAMAGLSSLLTASGLYLLSPVISGQWLSQAHLLPPLQILVWSIIPLSLSSILLAVTRLEREMKYEVWVRSLVEPGALLTFAAFFWVVGRREVGLYEAQVLALLAGLALAAWFSRRFGLDFSPARLKQAARWIRFGTDGPVNRLAAFALPITLFDLLAMSMMRLDILLLSRYVTVQEVGIYGAAAQVAFGIKKIRQAFDPIYLPVLSDQLRRKDLVSLRHNLEKTTHWIAVFSGGFIIAMVLFGDAILRIFGHEFAAGQRALVFISVGYAINGFWGITENVVLLQKPSWNVWNWIAGLALGLAAGLYFIPRYRLEGAGLTVVLVFAVLNLLRVWQTFLLTGIHPFNARFAAICAAVAAAGGSAYAAISWLPDVILIQVLSGFVILALYGKLVSTILRRPVSAP